MTGREALDDAESDSVPWYLHLLDTSVQEVMIVDHDSYPGVLVLRPSGLVTAGEVRGWLAELENVPAYHAADRDVIFDLCDANLSRLSREELQRIVQGLRDRVGTGPKRVVYVVPDELAFGILRMFITLADMRVPRDRGVFRSIPEALSWLHDGQSQ